MHKFLVLLDRKLNTEMKQYFESKGIEVYYYDDDIIPDFIFCQTTLTLQEIKKLDFVQEAKAPVGVQEMEE